MLSKSEERDRQMDIAMNYMTDPGDESCRILQSRWCWEDVFDIVNTIWLAHSDYPHIRKKEMQESIASDLKQYIEVYVKMESDFLGKISQFCNNKQLPEHWKWSLEDLSKVMDIHLIKLENQMKHIEVQSEAFLGYDLEKDVTEYAIWEINTLRAQILFIREQLKRLS